MRLSPQEKRAFRVFSYLSQQNSQKRTLDLGLDEEHEEPCLGFAPISYTLGSKFFGWHTSKEVVWSNIEYAEKFIYSANELSEVINDMIIDFTECGISPLREFWSNYWVE